MNRNRVQQLELIHDICEQFETLLRQKKQADIEDWVSLVSESDQPELFFELLRLEIHHNSPTQSNSSIGEYFRKYPDFSNEIVKVFGSNRASEDLEGGGVATKSAGHLIVAGESVGRYRIISPLGIGGFSAVYLAHDPVKNQAVAMKVLRHDEGMDTSRNIECIVNEANVLSKIAHPSIPKVYDAGKDESGKPWVAMEFIKGDSLYQMLATDQLSMVEVLRLLVKTADAVHEIHKCGFAHRDIKPDNIIIGLDGEPRIVDYGLALHENLQKDKAGERAGTTAFMSPEQVLGQSEMLDGRTDIWSLGVILYLVVAKRLPFQGECKEDIRENILVQPVRPPRQINGNVATIELENVCFRALRKNPEERFSTAHDFANALCSAIDVLPEEILLEEASRNRVLTKNEHCSIQLARQAKVWKAHPKAAELPNFYRYISFRLNTYKSQWSESESKMMSTATRHFARLGLLLSLLVLVFVVAQLQYLKFRHHVALREMLTVIKDTPIEDVQQTYEELSAFAPRKSYSAIESAFEAIKSNDQLFDDRVQYSIILSPNRPELRSTLKEKLIDASPEQIETLRQLTLDVEPTDNGLNDHWRRSLSKAVVATPILDGVEELWVTVPDSFSDSVKKYGGTLTSRFAWCSSMPLEKFQELSKEMREFRYRPVCVRPWINGHRKQVVAAIWHRDAADWKITYGLSPTEFMAMRISEPMHLVDVSDGLRTEKANPSLVAVWSSHKDPYAKSRHQLLAKRIPAISDPKWLLGDDSNYAIIEEDIDATYLSESPLLVDVHVDHDAAFMPLASREYQKIHVGEMIERSTYSDTPGLDGADLVAQSEAGAKLKINALVALGQTVPSTAHFDFDPLSASWEELHTRTLCYARSSDFQNAILSRGMLVREMKDTIRNRKRPYLSTRIAKAIDFALRIEMKYWEERNIRAFLRSARNRLDKAKARNARRDYTPWAEFYSLAMAANSIAPSLSSSAAELSELTELRAYLVQESLRARPTLSRRYLKVIGLRTTMKKPGIRAYIDDEELSVRSSSWTTFASGYQSKFLDLQSQKSHQRKCEGLAADYIPVSIVLGGRENGTLRIGSVWHRQLSTTKLAQQEQRAANAFCFALKFKEDLGIWKVLSTSRATKLKERIIETIHRFRIDVSLLLDRLNSSENEFERTSILKILRIYSAQEVDSADAQSIVDSVETLSCEDGTKDKELVQIIQVNLGAN